MDQICKIRKESRYETFTKHTIFDKLIAVYLWLKI